MFNTAHCVSILPQADKCGTCDTNATNDCKADCAQAWGGKSKRDLCGVCNGKNSCVDCAGVANGESYVGKCGTARFSLQALRQYCQCVNA